MRSRHEKVGSTVYLLEPNVKDGRGGLRDLQTAVWAARVKYKCRDLKELRRKGVVDAQAAEGIRHVMDYLLRIRNELHYILGKKSDVLSFEAQEQLAELFRYRKLGASLGVERFMRSYYLHAASAAQLTRAILEEVGRPLPEDGGPQAVRFPEGPLDRERGDPLQGKAAGQGRRGVRKGADPHPRVLPDAAEDEVGPLPAGETDHPGGPSRHRGGVPVRPGRRPCCSWRSSPIPSTCARRSSR